MKKGSIVNASEKKIEKQVQFWAIIGPVVILLTLIVLFVKFAQDQLYLPVIALVGLPICWRWKMPGLAATLVLLALAMLFAYARAISGELYWQIGMGMALALSFVATALSFDEMGALIGQIQAESKSRLDNYFHLDDKFKEAQKEWEESREKLLFQIQASSDRLSEKEQEIESSKLLLEALRDELKCVHQLQSKLILELQDFTMKEQEIDKKHQLVDEKAKELEIAFQRVQNEQIKQEHLGSQLASTQSLLVDTESELQRFQNEVIELAGEAGRLREALSYAEKKGEEALCLLSESKEKTESLEKLNHKLADEKLAQMALVEETCADLKLAAEEKERLEKICSQLHFEVERLKDKIQKNQIDLQEKASEIESLKQINDVQLLQFQSEKQKILAIAELNNQEKASRIEEITSALNQEKQKCENLNLEIKNLEKEQVSLKERLQKCQRFEKIPQGTGNTRSIEAMYLQLREQFEEKSKTLDETRKELFHTQEKVMSFQKEWEELTVYQPNQEDQALFQELIAAENENLAAQEEIKVLQEIISNLNQNTMAIK